MTKRPNPIDAHVGGRVRLRRMMLGMSQERLGDHLGLTFQQIQKYEKGANRIGASRLYAISQLLKAPVEFFFEGIPQGGQDENGKYVNGEAADGDRLPRPTDVVNSAEGMQLTAAFARIRHADTRKRIIELVKTLAEAERATTA